MIVLPTQVGKLELYMICIITKYTLNAYINNFRALGGITVV
jgi:hypothetical protein